MKSKARIFKLSFITLLFVSIASMIIFFGAETVNAQSYSGTYVDMYLKSNTFPDSLSEEMVFLDAGLSSTIIGHIGSQTDSRLVNFTSVTDTLDAANGFATIKAEDGFINSITITAPGYWFDDLIFSVNLTPNANSDLTVTALDKSGGTDSFAGWTALNAWVNGDNDILVLSTSGNLMQSVTIISSIGIAEFGIDQLKQTQISGLVPNTEVPEPATLVLFGLGLLGIAGVRKRRESR